MVEIKSAVEIYDQHAPEMENVPLFYDWVFAVFRRYHVPYDASILDVGCGTGALDSILYHSGYHALSGVDFSLGCLDLARARGLPIAFAQHDITQDPVRGQFDVVFMTTVIDFLQNPRVALNNIRKSLHDDSLFFVSIRNLHAYFPWYHFRSLANRLNRWPRAKHWFLHFTTPLSMRRDEYPVDEMFTVPQARDMLREADLLVVGEHSAQLLPMLWIWDVPQLIAIMEWIDRHIPVPKRLGYMYMFVCKKKHPEP